MGAHGNGAAATSSTAPRARTRDWTQARAWAKSAVIFYWLGCFACGHEGGSPRDVAASGPTQCAAYCAFMAVNCTRGNLQYPTNEACLSACAQYDVADDAATTTGDTLQCRMLYAVAADTPERKQAFCLNAGPSGGVACHL